MNQTTTVQSIRASKRPGWYWLNLDDAQKIKINDECILRFSLAAGADLDADQLEALKDLSTQQAFRSKFINWVSLRTRSQREILVYLRKNKVDKSYDQDYLNLAQKLGSQDNDFAVARARHRRRQLRSDRMIRLELRSQGLESDQIEQALSELEQDETWAAQQLIKGKLRSKSPDKAKAYLMRQGFSYDITNQLLKDHEVA